MSEHEFSILVASMKSVYTDPKFIPDKFAVKTWYALLKDIDYQKAADALQRYMSTNPYPPTPAGIREMSVKNEEYLEENELEAWGIVYKAICNSGYNYDSEFEKLPEMCKRTIRRPEILKEWSQLKTSEVQTVIKSNFEKTYKEECKKSREYAQLPRRLQENREKVLEEARREKREFLNSLGLNPPGERD